MERSLQPRAQPIELGGDIRFSDAENLGNLAVTAPFEIEEDQRAMEVVELVDDPVELANTIIDFMSCPVRHRCQDLIVYRLKMALAKRGASPIRDRDVQRNSIHPGRKGSRVVERAERAPQLGANLLCQVALIFRIPAVRVCDLEHDPLVPGQVGLESRLQLA